MPGLGRTLVSHTQFVGQSNCLGTGATVLTQANRTPRAMMFAQPHHSPRAHADTWVTSIDFPLHAEAISGFEPLHEGSNAASGYGETMCSGFAAQFAPGLRSGEHLLVDAHGRGSGSYEYHAASGNSVFVGPGSAHWANGRTLQELGFYYAAKMGAAYQWDGLVLVHGEQDSLNKTQPAAYMGSLSQWIALYNQDARGVLPIATRYMYARQASCSSQLFFPIAVATARAALNDRRIFCFAASYPYPFQKDNLHSMALAHQILGEQAGKWKRRNERRVALDGAPIAAPSMSPFVCKSATILSIGSQWWARCLFHVPVGDLVLDTTNVAAVKVGGYFTAGAAYHDDVNSLAGNSSGVAINGAVVLSKAHGGPSNGIDIPLSGNPRGVSPRWGFTFGESPTAVGSSGPSTGARTNIRDSDAEIGVLSRTPLYNWALHWTVAGS